MVKKTSGQALKEILPNDVDFLPSVGKNFQVQTISIVGSSGRISF